MRSTAAAGARAPAFFFAIFLLIGPLASPARAADLDLEQRLVDLKGGIFANSLKFRQAYWDVTNKNLGRVSIGFQSPATDDITIINLGSQMNNAAVHFNNAFRIRLALGSPIVTDLTSGQIAHEVGSFRGNFLRYDTPILVVGARIKF